LPSRTLLSRAGLREQLWPADALRIRSRLHHEEDCQPHREPKVSTSLPSRGPLGTTDSTKASCGTFARCPKDGCGFTKVIRFLRGHFYAELVFTNSLPCASVPSDSSMASETIVTTSNPASAHS